MGCGRALFALFMKYEPEVVFCTICTRRYSTARGAQLHMLFGHKIKLPLYVYFWKGLLADPDLDIEALPDKTIYT